MNGWRGAPRRSLFCGLLIAAAGIIGLKNLLARLILLRRRSRTTSQLRFDGVVPLGQGFMALPNRSEASWLGVGLRPQG